MSETGISVAGVQPDSPAAAAGLAAGDRILTVNGHEIIDELAWRFRLAERERALVRYRRQNGAIRRWSIDTDETPDPGVIVAEFVTRRCGNACLFCFVDQLPPVARPGLKVKDDDYRLSFLYGNYITLTNVTDKDIERIIAERLSPLYVSIHATDPELRARVMGRKKADNPLRKLTRLARGEIRVHTQVVLMPGINDGAALEKTVFDLYRLYPAVNSVAIVPVGLSAYAPRERGLRPVTPAFSRTLLRQVQRWRGQCHAAGGSAFVFPADEFFLLAGVEIPAADYYEDFAQIEDGVGMVRTFLDDFAAATARQPHMEHLRGTLVTGALFSPILRRRVEELNRQTESRLEITAAVNHFLGKRVTVAGLLSGSDVLRALRDKDMGDFVILPGEMLATGSNLLLDDMTLKDLERQLGRPVYAGGRSVREFFQTLRRVGRKYKTVRK